MPGVSQISPPMRIVLGVAVAFLAAYMVFLRPKAATTPAPAPTPAGNVHTGKPAVTSLGKAVQAAQGAAAATTAQQTKEGTDAGLDPSASASGASTASGSATQSSAATSKATPAKAAAPAIDTAGLPRDVAKAIQQRKVLALLFTNHHSADDRLTAQSLRRLHHFDSRVFVRSVPLSSISHYSRITRGVDVQQSPTVVVVDRKLKATALVGYSDPLALEQAVTDAMRASGGIFVDNRFYSRLNGTCSTVIRGLNAIPQPTSVGQYKGWLHRVTNRLDGFVSDVKGIHAPARYAPVKRTFVQGASRLRAAAHDASAKLGKHPGASDTVSSLVALAGADSAGRQINRVSDRHHLIYCGSLG
jgi:hypothetical protein